MAFGLKKPARGHELGNLPDDWVGWLEPGAEVEGNIKVTGGLIRLNARVTGNIASDSAVVIHDQGEVEGEVHARIVSVTGKLKGAVHADERLEIKGHGVVLGDIYTPCLLVDPGAFFDGACHMPAPEPVTETTDSPRAEP